MPDFTYSGNGIRLTEQFEGCPLDAYKDCAGVWTIGYGHTRGVFPGMSITHEIAEAFLKADIKAAETTVNKLVTAPITQNEFDALVDFEFNTGGLKNSTLLRLLNLRNYEGAAREFVKWSHVSGKVVAGLLRRREAEENLFVLGDK